MLENFAAGGAAVNQICATYGIGLKVFELALDLPTGDITRAPAMDEAACAGTIAFGMEAVAGEIDVLGLGEMGIGNTTVASAIYAALYGGGGAEWVGRGTRRRRLRDGAQGGGGRRRACQPMAGHLKDPLEVLRRLGGREVAALCGAILAGAHAARAGRPRWLRGHGGGGGAARARSPLRSSIVSPATSRPSRPTAVL